MILYLKAKKSEGDQQQSPPPWVSGNEFSDEVIG